MSGLIKFHAFSEDLALGVHDFTTATALLKLCLSNTAPVIATDAVLTDITQIAYTNVSETYPADTLNVGTPASGIYSVTGTDLVVTASGGAVATFRYGILYNDTPSGDPLIGYWDFGVGGVTLADTEVYNILFGSSLFRIF